MNEDIPETESQRGRVAIWSVAEEYHNAFSIMLLMFWLAGMTAYAVYRRATFSDEDGVLATVVQLIQDIGIVGLSSAVLSLMVVAIIAGGRAAMVLFDWPTRKKIQDRRDAEWRAWYQRNKEIIARGGKPSAPPDEEANKPKS